MLKETPEAKEMMRVHFFGQGSDAIRGKLSQLKNPDVIVSGGTLSRPAILEHFCASDVLYFMPPQGRGLATGKLFEYLASGRPILSVPGDGDLTDRIIYETKAGEIARTPESVAGVLRGWFHEWRKMGAVASRSVKEEIYKYTRQSQVEQMAAILDQAACGGEA
jgi:hypothetical protein